MWSLVLKWFLKNQSLWFLHLLMSSLPKHVISQGQLIKICSAMSIWCLYAPQFPEQSVSFFRALVSTAGVWLRCSLPCDPSGHEELLREQCKKGQVAAGFVDIKHLLGGSKKLMLLVYYLICEGTWELVNCVVLGPWNVTTYLPFEITFASSFSGSHN